MNTTTYYRLPWYGMFLIQFLVIGPLQYALEPFMPVKHPGIDWVRIGTAAACGGVGGAVIELVNFGVNRRRAKRDAA